MENNNLWSVLITAITVLGGSQAFRYYEKRAMRKERDDEFIRHDCKDRISKLEALLESSSKEKDELRNMVLTLTKEVAALSVKVEFLTKENDKLEKALPKTKKQLNG
jgi:peptidoglycan hydrolase CwlO-like protein